MTNHININKEEQMVSSQLNYIKIDNYTYTNENHSIYSPFSGTVVDRNNESIIIKCENGYYVFFSSLINISVRKYDVISNSDKLAEFIETFNFYLMKDGKVYSYEEIVSNYWSYWC